MIKTPRTSFRKLVTLSLLVASLTVVTGCNLLGTRTKVNVPPLLTPLAAANRDQLISIIDRHAALRSIQGRVDLQFEDNSFAEAGIAEKYKLADGNVTLQRPGKVYLIIKVPFIATDIAQMTSDGSTFRVAVLQGAEKYRRFVKGTNDAVYEPLEINGAEGSGGDSRTMSEKETVSALSNLRPQHLTDALLVRPTDKQAGLLYTQSEFYQDEPDTRRQAKKNQRVVRGYYLLDELTQNGGEVRLVRRFWFDRVGSLRLARLQTFDNRGLLITDISYRDEKPLGGNGQVHLPTRIEITRPHDRYKLNVTYQSPGSVVIDRDYNPEAFVLENRWQLPEVDLDASRSKKMTVIR